MDTKQSATISCDMSLFIRLLEVAREEIKSDAELHHLVERCSEAQALKDSPLTMDDYENLVGPPKAELNAATRLRAYSSEGDVKATITLNGPQECVDRALGLLSMLHLNGGHSAYFGINWDGDGSDRLRITGRDYKPGKYKELVNVLSSYGGAVEIVAEGLTGFVLNNSKDPEHPYLKSTKVYPEEAK